MKANLLISICCALLLGYLCANFLFSSYQETSRTTFSGENKVFFLQYGANQQEIPTDIQLDPHIEVEQDGNYYVYVGITTDYDNAKKIQDFYEQMAERGAKVRVKDMATGDKVEHTRVFDSGAEKRDARKALGDEADGLRLRVHNQKFIGSDNVNLHAAVEEGASSHEAAYNTAKDISGDRTYEPNEAQNFAAMCRYRRARNVPPQDSRRRLTAGFAPARR